MSEASLPPGKLDPRLLRELLAGGPPPPPELIVPPGIGEDGCAIRVEGGVLIAATDPITLTGRSIGGHSVLINANDVAVMGAEPRWFLAAVMLPLGTTERDVRELFSGMREGLAAVGAHLVGGHTEVTEAVRQPVVVGQMLGFREDGRFVRTGGMQPGDHVVQVGPAPVEGAAVLAAEARDRLGDVSAELLDQAGDAMRSPGISVVSAALLATELGATALHDPTEGGLSSGLHELAEASAAAIEELDPDRVLWFAPGVALCEAIGANPWGTLASGALLASFPAERSKAALRAFEGAGLPAARIAIAATGSGVSLKDGSPLQRFDRDELSRVLG